jgi:hypothetical protein
MSLITRILPPDEKGFKLTFQEMDNNLYYLQSLGVSGITFSANTLTITNPTGGTKSVIINAGVTFTGGTVSGATSFTNGLSANIISATTYQNLPIDIRVTGGTYSAGTATFKNNTGGTFNVTGFLTGVTDTYVTGGTYSNGTATFTNNSGSTFNVSGFYTGDTTLITGATNVGTGITIFDSVVNRSLQINSITGDTLEKITTSLSNNTIQLGVNEQNLTLWDLVVQGNRLLNGNVSYISGLTFNVSPLEYLINGTIYDIASTTTVTLNSGDSTYDRIDVIYADINGNTGVLEGTPSENPEKPIVDGFNQVEVTFVLVPANSIIPDINQVIVYNENLGPPNEWTFGSVGLQPTRIIGSSTDQAYTGSTSIRVSGVTGAFTTSFRLTGNTILDTNQYATLQFAIRNLSANTTTSQIRLRFLSTGGTQNGNTVFMNGAGSSGFVQYTSTNTASWQLISIPLWRFYLTNTNVQVVEFSFNSPNARYYFDLIEFVAGTSSSPPSNSWTTIKGDGTTTITAPNPNSTLSILGGTNIGSSILGSSSIVLNLDNNIILTGVTANTVSATTYQNLPTDVRVTGASYSNNTFTYTNNTGGTFNTSFNTVTGLTVNGNLNVTGNTNIGGTLTANTISANTLNINGVNITGDTYVTGLTFNTGNYNLTIGRNDGVTFTDSLGILAGDLSVTGGTYDIFTGDATFTNNTGGTFIVSGFLVGYTDLLVTGATYNNNTFTFKNSSGGTFNVSFNTVTGLTSTGTIQSSILSATTYQNLPDNVTGNYLPLSGGTVIGSTNFTNGLTANTISATTYQNLPDNVTGNYLPISGGTVTGSTVFTNGLSANTISATTYQNLPKDIRITGGTYSNNTFTYTNNTGGTFNVLFNTVSGLTVNGDLTVTGTTSSGSISATTYQNLPTDVRVTGGTYSAGTIIFTNNTGGTFNVTGLVTGTTTTIGGDYLPLSGGTVTGQTIFNQGVTADTISATTYQNLPDNVTGNYLPISGGTVTGTTSFTNGLTADTISATTYQNLPISGLTEGNNINISGSNGNFTISVTGLTQGLSGEYLALSGGTVSGGTQFTNGLTANTISATTYQNLPVTADTFVTGFSYSNNTFTIGRNQGLTPLTSSINSVTGLTVNGNLNVTGTTISNTISATTYQNLPVTADTFVTAFTYNSNTFTIGRNQGLSALTATIGSVTGLTSTGTISSSSLSATTLTVNGVSITGDTFVTGGTYSAGTITFRNNQNTTFPVTGLTQPFTGGTVSGPTNFTNGLTANTISATTYQNLPVTADTFTTGFTYSSNTFTIGRNQGLSGLTATINTVTGLTSTGTISSSSLSATTLTVNGVSITGDTFVTGGTYSAGTITFRNNRNTTFPVTGLTQPFTGGTVSGSTNFTNGLTANTISATTLTVNGVSITGDTFVTGGTYSAGTITFRNNRNTTFPVTGFTSGVTITNNTNNNVLTATGTDTINGEGNLTYDGTILRVSSNNDTTVNNVIRFEDVDSNVAANQNIGRIEFMTSDISSSPTPAVKAYIAGVVGSSIGEGAIVFGTTGQTGSISATTSTTLTGERMRIDEVGFVGIGTSVPSYRLDVNSGTRVTDQISFSVTNGSTEGVRFAPYVGANSFFSISELGDNAIIGTVGENFIIGTQSGAAWRFSGSAFPTDGIIHTRAAVGIATKPDAGTTFHVNGTIRYTNRPAAGTITAIGYDVNGDLKASSSSRRFKENIEPYGKGLNEILSLSSVTFTYLNENIVNAGFIVEDLYDLGLTEFVINEDNQPTSIPYANMVSLLVNGIKEQQQQIESLKTEIQDLKNRISNIGG